MEELSNLERAALEAIADQVSEHTETLRGQIASARVASRENTGAGFYTKLAIVAGSKIAAATSPIGDIGANVEGIENGVGFLLWLRDGLADKLEGYTYGDATTDLDLIGLRYSNLGPRSRLVR